MAAAGHTLHTTEVLVSEGINRMMIQARTALPYVQLRCEEFSTGAVRAVTLSLAKCIPLASRSTPDSAGVRHFSLPLLHISVPVFVLLFSPKLFVGLAIMLNISPLTAPREDPFNVVNALHIWRKICGKQRR